MERGERGTRVRELVLIDEVWRSAVLKIERVDRIEGSLR